MAADEFDLTVLSQLILAVFSQYQVVEETMLHSWLKNVARITSCIAFREQILLKGKLMNVQQPFLICKATLVVEIFPIVIVHAHDWFCFTDLLQRHLVTTKTTFRSH